MARRRAVPALVVAASAVAATVLLRRRAAARRERVDLYFDDGSMLSLAEGTGDAERLLPLAREVLRAAGS